MTRWCSSGAGSGRRGGALLVLLLVCVVLSVLLDRSSAQVNFTPGWGKRGGGGALDSPSSPCKPSMESLMYLYKLIQGEAQKLADCDKFAN
ncbi:hypertrehalosaemic prohormone [Ischnura elegans]|uniref:hypertrehalosaemic prohormone n=1 Tax=Ischnura elegans TaxID=197161 RepID=UPI001ED87B1B|nr:hypertrehalosaemic prohormone [Ischnura elegans]